MIFLYEGTLTEIAVKGHVLGGCGRRPLASRNDHTLARVLPVDGHEMSPSQARALWVDDVHAQQGGYRSIHCISALLKNVSKYCPGKGGFKQNVYSIATATGKLLHI